MNEHELLRVISFLEKTRIPYMDLIPIAEEDPSWNILFFLVKQHVRGATVTMSALASVANVPYATAMRRIHGLIEQGHVVREPTSKTGKSFALHPSPHLLDAFGSYARQVKALLAETFGYRKQQDEDQFYFGGSYFAAQIIPPPQLAESLVVGRNEIKFLLNDDNYFSSMRNMWSDFRSNISSSRNFRMVKLPGLLEEIIGNSTAAVSRYDIAAVNMPWLGELVTRDVLLPLDEYVSASHLSHPDFHPSVWSMGNWRGTQYGIPLYCTVEMLAARADLFDAESLKYPTTFDETVEAAKHFHRPERGHYGIAWNGAEGMPVASTFMILMACCGETILDMPKGRAMFTADQATADHLRPRVMSDAGLEVLDYLHRLVDFSPPNILDMGWDERTDVFLSGKAALAYCWTVRAARFESDLNSSVRRKVRYLQHPRGRRGSSYSSIGGFLLGIPRNLPEERARLAFEAIAWMASPEAMKAHVRNGFPVAPRFSVAADPEAAAASPIVRVVDKLAKRNLLKSLARPAVPGYQRIETILGSLVHKALKKEVSDRAALEKAQGEIDRIMIEFGCYKQPR